MAGYGDNTKAQAYWAAAGYVVPAGTSDSQITAARQRGSLVIDRYEARFSGTRTGGFAQERAWPRTGASTYYGEAIPSDVVPAAIENASYEAAFLELTNPGSLSPVITGSATVKREKVGQLEVEYSTFSSTNPADIIAMATPVVTVIEGMLWPFLTACLPGTLVV
ncbi:DnaT-like ssDNA-binding protein [Rhizobium phaseoli]|uniref:DnaT-like ssDNA-binding protein n=1 Tax=Rhizobium phaseoli TaxID=396 RepID=UPI0002FAE3A5|nr:DnaT-like ssDNA-binding protein [Rhizobium phaseoli]KKZ89060.1 phage-related protein [Rhizobium phaseoli Ch24-10]